MTSQPDPAPSTDWRERGRVRPPVDAHEGVGPREGEHERGGAGAPTQGAAAAVAGEPPELSRS